MNNRLVNIILSLLILLYLTGETYQGCTLLREYCRRYIRYPSNMCPGVLKCTNMTDNDAVYGDLRSETSLVIVNSNISNLESTMFKNVNPTNLSVTNSGVKRLGQDVFRRSSRYLKTVNLAFNDISEIDNNVFSNIIALSSLNMSNNRINYVATDAFKGSSSLEILDVSSNQLEIVDFITESSADLVELYLQNNRITRLLNSTFNNPKLERLDLQNNQIELIEDAAFLSLTSLKFLNLGENKLCKMNDGILQTYFLRHLDGLEDLRLHQNDLKITKPNTFSRLNTLKNLNINGNNFVNISIIVNDLHNITSLDISNNNIKTIPVDLFKNLAHLNQLNLSSNSIEELLPGTFSKLSYLNMLDLQINKLKTLPNGLLQQNDLLSKLYINDNLLNEFSSNVLFHRARVLVALDGNEWSCDQLSSITRMLEFAYTSRVQEGTHHSTPNIRGNSCNVNSTAKTEKATIETLLSQNVQLLKNLNELIAENEMGNEQIIDLLNRKVFSQNDTSDANVNSTVGMENENVVSTLVEIRDIISKTSEGKARFLEESPAAAFTDTENHERSGGNSSLLVALLCVQIIFMLFIVSAFVYYVKFKGNFNRNSGSTLLDSFNE